MVEVSSLFSNFFVHVCIGHPCPGFGSGEAAVVSLRRGQGLPRARHSWFQPAPTWSLCRTKLSPSVKLFVPLSTNSKLRKGQNTRERKGKEAWDRAVKTPRSEKKEGEEVSQMLDQRFPWSLRETTMEQVFPCKPWRSLWWTRYSPCNPWNTPCQSRWVFPDRNCGWWRAHSGAGLPSMTAAHGKDSHWSREKCEGEGVAERNSYELTTSPSPLCCSECGGGCGWVGSEGVMWSLRCAGLFCLFFTVQLYSNLQWIKLNFPKPSLFYQGW